MSLLQFLRILWARRMIVLVSTISAVIAAVVAIQMLAPRYQAEARLELTLATPDAVTGEQIASPFARAYTKTQEQRLDLGIARLAVGYLGLARNPELQEAYRERGGGDGVDFETWLARQILGRADARLIQGSNILAISFTASTPQMARDGANALRRAYMEGAVALRQRTARENAAWYARQAQLARMQLQQLEAVKTRFERQHGLILQSDTDIDNIRLQALASQGAAPVAGAVGGRPGVPSSAAATELAQVDSRIAQASRIYGPNHPQMQDLQARRTALAQQMARETVAAAAAAAPSPAGGGVSSQREYQAQRERVIGQREELNQLRRMQAEIDVQRAEFVRTAGRAAELRQEADAPDTLFIERDAAVAPEQPIFPNPPLILALALIFGLGLGVLLALLAELVARRVRGAEDLAGAVEAPLLVVISSSADQKQLPSPAGRSAYS